MSDKGDSRKKKTDDQDVDNLWRPDKSLGLARAIAKAGYATRSQADAMVRSGRVQVDQIQVTDPSVPVGPQSVIRLDGQPLVTMARRYFALNKPVRVATSTADRGGRRHVTEFFPPEIPGLRPAGRLDANTEGLLLISNDSGWNALAASAAGLEKEYEVSIGGRMSELEARIITAGMHLPNLGFIRPVELEVLAGGDSDSKLRLVIVEGKNRQVRRIFSSLRHNVLGLRRVRIGPITLGNLPPGRFRSLTSEEIACIRNCTEPDQAP
jgi:23S rRNA pseudouridine2605 synthase